MRISASDTI